VRQNAGPAARRPPVTAPGRPLARAPRPSLPSAPRLADLEDLLGGRVLAWVGGLAMLLGVVFLLVIAVSRGWLGEEARVLVAAGASFALLAGGTRLHERRGRTDAALAAAAAGVAGLFATLVVATQAYGLLLPVLGALLALPVGAAATALAIRWRAPGMGALGIVGALLAPVLVGAEATGPTLHVLAVATASAVGVLLWQRWGWLAFATFLIATPQWASWIDGAPPLPGVLATLLGFGTLNVLAAVGYELRARVDGLRLGAHVLLVLNALVLAWMGWLALEPVAGNEGTGAWLVGLALAHLAAGLTSERLARVPHALALAATVLGVMLADVAFAFLADGLPLVLGWSATTVGAAALLRRVGGRDAGVILAGVGGHLALALGHALAQADRAGGAADVAALAGLGAVVAGCIVSARIAEDGRPRLRMALDALGVAVLAHLLAVALDGVALTLALAAEGVGLALLAQQTRDGVALAGTLALGVIAGAYAVARLAPAAALVDGVADVPAAVLGLLAVVAALLAAGRAWASAVPEVREALDLVALAALVHLLGVTLAGAPLTVALAAEAVAVAILGRRSADGALRAAGLALAGVATLHGLVVLAPPVALLDGVADVPGAVAALLAAVLAVVVAGERRPPALAAAGVLLLHLASVALVTQFQGGGPAIGELDPREQGQALLSGLWALVGVAVLVAGLLRDEAWVRRAALALLGVTVAKVFLYDLASLGSLYRVGSLVGLGALLLCGAFAWQRVRPRALPDLRDAAPWSR